MILMMVLVMTTKMQTSAEEMCLPPKVEYWRSAAGGVPLRPSRVIENNQRTNMFDRILTTRHTTANKGKCYKWFKIRIFIASWQSFYILSFWSRTTRNGTELMNKDFLGQQGKKGHEVGCIFLCFCIFMNNVTLLSHLKTAFMKLALVNWNRGAKNIIPKRTLTFWKGTLGSEGSQICVWEE